MKINEIRCIKKSFRFTKNEWAQIEIKCKVADITPTQYFQQLALNGKTAKSDCIKEKQIYLGKISMIGSDISYIARQLKESGKFDVMVIQILLKIEKQINDEWLI